MGLRCGKGGNRPRACSDVRQIRLTNRISRTLIPLRVWPFVGSKGNAITVVVAGGPAGAPRGFRKRKAYDANVKL
jgi:hypothetical protein